MSKLPRHGMRYTCVKRGDNQSKLSLSILKIARLSLQQFVCICFLYLAILLVPKLEAHLSSCDRRNEVHRRYFSQTKFMQLPAYSQLDKRYASTWRTTTGFGVG
jgi:hypothetical protein